MWAFILKYWKYLILCIPIIALVIWVILLQVKLKEKDSIIYYKDSLITIDSITYKNLAQEYLNEKDAKADLQRYNKDLADKLNKANESMNTYIQIITKLKSQQYIYIDTVKVFEVVNDTILVPVGDDVVNINAENSLYKIYGSTRLFPHKSYEINFEGKPITLDVVISEDVNGVYNSYISTNNSDLEIIKFNTKFLNRTELSFWSKLYGITSVNFGSKKGFLDLGIGYKKWGLKGHIGYDDYNFKKENQFYGLGIMYKLF